MKRAVLSEEQKRLERLRNVKSTVGKSMKHNDWTESQVNKRSKMQKLQRARQQREQEEEANFQQQQYYEHQQQFQNQQQSQPKRSQQQNQPTSHKQRLIQEMQNSPPAFDTRMSNHSSQHGVSSSGLRAKTLRGEQEKRASLDGDENTSKTKLTLARFARLSLKDTDYIITQKQQHSQSGMLPSLVEQQQQKQQQQQQQQQKPRRMAKKKKKKRFGEDQKENQNYADFAQEQQQRVHQQQNQQQHYQQQYQHQQHQQQQQQQQQQSHSHSQSQSQTKNDYLDDESNIMSMALPNWEVSFISDRLPTCH